MKIPTDFIETTPKFPTTTKMRILAGDDHTSKQQVIRIDKEVLGPFPETLERRILNHIETLKDTVDAFIVSDYGYDFISPGVLTALKEVAQTHFTVVDSRYRIKAFSGVHVMTPKQSEAQRATGKIINSEESLVDVGNELLNTLDLEALLITMGNRGMALFEKGGKTTCIPIAGSDEIIDVTGAGDTVASVLTLAKVCGASYRDAARLANFSGGLVVMKPGAATLSSNELLTFIRSELIIHGPDHS
jgi:rfaE bifunctional protein kinase chain/domain